MFSKYLVNIMLSYQEYNKLLYDIYSGVQKGFALANKYGVSTTYVSNLKKNMCGPTKRLRG